MTIVSTMHVVATIAMVGVIWSVQWVQYPLFASVDRARFRDYHRVHVERIGAVVAPLMILEVATGIALLASPGVATSPGYLAALALLGVVWLSTLAIQVPLHRQLSSRWSADDVRRLVRGNWLRTLAWTARAPLVLTALPGALG